MEWWQALILGIVEGLTEYLPVSSTGHLIVTQRLLGIDQSEVADAFAICIQAGAIVAVLGLYLRRVTMMVRGVLGRNSDGLRLTCHLALAFLPAVVAGLLLEKPIKHYLFGGNEWGLWPVVAAWFAGGVAILAVAWARKGRTARNSGRDLLELTWHIALIIGTAQCIAMWPGVSRSLVTIVCGVLVGLRLSAAVEFSFLLGVLTLGAATCHDALKHGSAMLEAFGPLPLAIGFLAAWASAVLAVRWMVSYLNRHGMAVFGYYRIAIAIAATAWLLAAAHSHHPLP